MSESKVLSILKAKILQTFPCHIKSCEGLTLGTILGTVGNSARLRLVIYRCKLLKTNGAKGGTRTPTGITPPDPKSVSHKDESLGNIRKHN